jgi:hypothetical protein
MLTNKELSLLYSGSKAPDTFEEVERNLLQSEKDLHDSMMRTLKKEDNSENIIELEENGFDLIKDMMFEHKEILVSGYTLKEYIKAIKFIAYHHFAGLGVTKAYRMTFPERIKMKEGNTKRITNLDKLVSSSASSYKSTILVKRLLENVQIPYHLLLTKERIGVLQTLRDIITDEDISPGTRVNAADKFLTHTNAPTKTESPKVDVTVNNVSAEQYEAEKANTLTEQLLEFAIVAKQQVKDGKISIEQLGNFSPKPIMVEHDDSK